MPVLTSSRSLLNTGAGASVDIQGSFPVQLSSPPCKHQLLGFSESEFQLLKSECLPGSTRKLHTRHWASRMAYLVSQFTHLTVPHWPTASFFTLCIPYILSGLGGFFHVAGHIQSLLLHMEEQFPFVESGELCQW